MFALQSFWFLGGKKSLNITIIKIPNSTAKGENSVGVSVINSAFHGL